MYENSSAHGKRKITPIVRFFEPLPSDISWWRHAAGECLKNERRLFLREREFLDAMVEWEGRPSQAQVDWISRIHARLYPGVPA